jgi:hypothetical protein
VHLKSTHTHRLPTHILTLLIPLLLLLLLLLGPPCQQATVIAA